MTGEFHTKVETLAQLMEERMGVRGQGFATKLKKAGRRLPRWARRDGRVIVAAIALDGHPKTAIRIDMERTDRAVRNLTRYVEGIDPWDRRKARILDGLAMVGVALFVAIGAVITVAALRGLI